MAGYRTRNSWSSEKGWPEFCPEVSCGRKLDPDGECPEAKLIDARREKENDK